MVKLLSLAGNLTDDATVEDYKKISELINKITGKNKDVETDEIKSAKQRREEYRKNGIVYSHKRGKIERTKLFENERYSEY